MPYVGHGVVAGTVTYADGTLVEDVIVTLSQRGRVIQTTSTYIKPRKPDQNYDWHINRDPAWQENFVLGDVPEGEYEISVTAGNERITETITVRAGTTNFIALSQTTPATPQPVEASADSGGTS